MNMTFRFCCVPFPSACPGLHTSITLPTAPTAICTTCAFLVFHILEISLSSSWYSLFIVFVLDLFIYLSELSGRIGQSGIRTRQFCRTERELPFSKLLNKLVVLSMKRRFGQKQFSIPRLDALHFGTGGPVRPAVPYGQRLARALPVSRSHLIWLLDTPFSTSSAALLIWHQTTLWLYFQPADVMQLAPTTPRVASALLASVTASLAWQAECVTAAWFSTLIFLQMAVIVSIFKLNLRVACYGVRVLHTFVQWMFTG